MAAVTLEDIVKKMKPDISDATSTKVSKLIGIYTNLLLSAKAGNCRYVIYFTWIFYMSEVNFFESPLSYGICTSFDCMSN